MDMLYERKNGREDKLLLENPGLQECAVENGKKVVEFTE